jgi:hypothetical protein
VPPVARSKTIQWWLNKRVMTIMYPNEGTVRANRSGKLTLAQIGSLTLSTLVTSGLATTFGGLGGVVAINRFSAQTADGVTLTALGGLLLLGVFAVGLVVYGVQRIMHLVQDMRAGVQMITGTLHVVHSRRQKTNVRGSVSFGTRYRLQVRSSAQPISLSIGQSLYHRIQQEQTKQPYTVYYTRGSKTILALESESQNNTLT